MKVLLFTHKIDIDGMGCAVLGKLAFKDIEIVYSDTFEINQQIQRFIDDGSIYNYDKIYVTDLCIKKPLIDYFENDTVLKNKTQILDHHKSEIDEGNANYSFSKIVVQNEKGKCSGTSLFYNYLLNNNYLSSNEIMDLFVELTRQYDTWEWKTIYNNETANDLNIVFMLLGLQNYVEVMYNKLKYNLRLFDNEILLKINQFKVQQQKICEDYIKTMSVVNLKGYEVGVIDNVEDKYKNDIAEMLKVKGYAIDFVAMLINSRNTISFRSVKSGVDVGVIASMYGGKGHKEAGSCLQSQEILKDLGITGK